MAFQKQKREQDLKDFSPKKTVPTQTDNLNITFYNRHPVYNTTFGFAGLIPSLSLQQHRMALQKQKREQDLKEQREAERNSPAKKKSSSATSLLCAKKSNKRKRHNSPFKKGKLFIILDSATKF